MADVRAFPTDEGIQLAERGSGTRWLRSDTIADLGDWQ